MGERKDVLQPSSAVYEAADFFLLRAPALPVDVFSQLAPVGAVAPADEGSEEKLEASRQRCYDWLQKLEAQPQIELALAAASSAIFEGLARIRRGETSHKAQRFYSRMLRYMIRMSTRPTPFGLFAGVAVGTFAPTSVVRLGAPALQRIRTRPDMSWLFSVIQKIEQTQELVSRLHVVVNQTVHVAGGRAVLPLADVYGQQDPRSISLRATPVVRYVLERARQPIPYRELYTGLLENFPQARPEQADRLLQQLWENHFIISNLRPPLTSATPASYVLEQLPALPEAEAVSKPLRETLQKTREIDRAGTGGSVRLMHELKQLQERLVPGSQRLPFQIDASLRLESGQLTGAVGEVAARAGETLLRLSPFSQGLPHLQDYRAAFIERYGLEAEVPVLDLLSPEAGLDAPPTYTRPPRSYQLPYASHAPDTRRRDAILGELIAQAINERHMEVELTPSLLRLLEQWSPQSNLAPPPSLEIYMQLHAASQEALDRGEWRAVISPNCGSPGAGRTFCRFFDILEPEDLERLRRFIKREEALSPDVIFAELSYLPTNARAANVTVRPALRDYEIVVNTTPSVASDNVIRLNDLAVGIRDNRFYLRSLSLGKEVIVCQSHMLNHAAAPNICRFLLEVAQDNRPCLAPFDWGTHGASPFLPRIVQGQVVLCPAQWHVKASMIQPAGSGNEEIRWLYGLHQWRTQWRVPRYVYLVEADNRLLLDLEHPLMAAELCAELQKGDGNGSVTLQEMLPDFDHLWLQDSNNARYVAEIVVPLIRATDRITPASRAIAAKRCYPPRIITREERSALPGSSWCYLKLYAAFKQHEGLIAGPLREIALDLQKQGMIDRWFFIRYADPEPHLRVRFHAAAPQTQEALMTTALAWGRQQVERGLASYLCIDTYSREIERYGGPQAIDIIEQVFTINSAVVSSVVADQYAGRISIDPLAVAVLSLDQFFDAWGLCSSQRLQHLEKRTEKYQASEEFRKQRKLFCELLAPWDQTYDSGVITQRERLNALLSPQREALRLFSAQIGQLAAEKALWVPEENILDSLAHMHLNRLLGIDRERERKAYAFWRHALESVHRRPARKNLLQEPQRQW